MATTETHFRDPKGPAAKVHKFLDSQIDKIKAGTVSRKELLDKLVAKGLPEGTIGTQASRWAKLNSLTFARPKDAEANRKTAAAAKRAANKAAKAPKLSVVTPAKTTRRAKAAAEPQQAAA